MAKKTIEINRNDDRPVSLGRAELEALIERYKVQNPVKYELKKDALQKQLESL